MKYTIVKFMSYFRISNYGLYTSASADSNIVTLSVVVLIRPHKNVKLNDQHKLVVNVNGIYEREIIITVGENGTYPVRCSYVYIAFII